jgi:peptidylprolyl isomerase
VKRPRHLTLILFIAIPLALAACGSGDTKTSAIPSEDAPTSATATTETQTTTEATTAPAKPSPGVKALAEKISDDTKKRPKIPKPDGEAPGRLMVVDIVEGKGPAAKAGDKLEMDYAGASWSTGEEFDASWKTGQRFPLDLGAGGVIQGWDLGIPGMKQGGRRLLVIPPDLGYGAQGQGNIRPNETLVFVVDARKLN